MRARACVRECVSACKREALEPKGKQADVSRGFSFSLSLSLSTCIVGTAAPGLTKCRRRRTRNYCTGYNNDNHAGKRKRFYPGNVMKSPVARQLSSLFVIYFVQGRGIRLSKSKRSAKSPGAAAEMHKRDLSAVVAEVLFSTDSFSPMQCQKPPKGKNSMEKNCLEQMLPPRAFSE